MAAAIRVIVVLFVALLAGACGDDADDDVTSSASSVPAAATSAPATTVAAAAPTDEMVDIGGRRLHLQCMGEGTPTVLLDHGLGDSISGWRRLLRLARDDQTLVGVRVCAYDRAGRGLGDLRSDDVEGTRTGADLADDVHRLISAGSLGPIVAVGHSIAGMHLRLLADRHPDDLAALVLVDPTVPGEPARAAAVLPAPTDGEARQLADMRSWAAAGDDQGADNKEHLDIGSTSQQVQATGTLGDLPLVVLTAGAQVERYTGDALPPGLEVSLQTIHEDVHAELVAQSSNSAQIVVPGASHFVQEDEPERVLDVIRVAVETARDGGSIADRLAP